MHEAVCHEAVALSDRALRAIIDDNSVALGAAMDQIRAYLAVAPLLRGSVLVVSAVAASAEYLHLRSAAAGRQPQWWAIGRQPECHGGDPGDAEVVVDLLSSVLNDPAPVSARRVTDAVDGRDLDGVCSLVREALWGLAAVELEC